jgi:hypothetical protein
MSNEVIKPKRGRPKLTDEQKKERALQIKEYQAEYRKKNKSYQYEYRTANHEHLNELKKQWYDEHKEEANAKSHEWYVANKQKLIEKNKIKQQLYEQYLASIKIESKHANAVCT